MLYLHFDKTDEFEFCSAGKFVARSKHIHPRRNLKSAVILVGSEGECPIEQGGRSQVLKKGDRLLLFPGVEHGGTSPVSNTQSHFWCHFNLPQGCIINKTAEICNGFVVPEFGHLTDAKSVNILFRQLIDAANRSYTCQNTGNVICGSYVKILLSTLADEFVLTCHQQNLAPQKAIISRIEEWIRFHCHEKITVSDVSDEFHYNADYLTQIFKVKTGLTVCGYINLMRINESKAMLLNSDMKIAEIAQASGFSDEKYFMRLFKKTVGVTPSQYRDSFFRMHFN